MSFAPITLISSHGLMMRHTLSSAITRAAILMSLLLLGSVAMALAGDEQPINFSHKIHATDNQINCQYCHLYARRSYSSGVPPVSTCVGCHGTKEIPLVAAQGKPEADKVREYWAKQEAIPWQKIHDVPDFVRFPHKKHINADASRFRPEAGQNCSNPTPDNRSIDCKVQLFKQGGDTRCEACHGNIKEMAVVKTVDENFGMMGWCLECHLEVKGAKERKSATTTIGGWFNAKQQDAEREKQIGLINEKGYHNPNLTDCVTCHY